MKTRYHKENLRGQLVAAALAHVELDGHEGLTVRNLAQRVGVTTAAPYHHFADRNAILVAVADMGFDILLSEFERAMADHDAPETRLVARTNGFLDFVTARPRLFALMYDSELTKPVLNLALQARYAAIYQAVLADFGRLYSDERRVEDRVVSYWSTVFGFAFLSTNAMLAQFTGENGESVKRRIVESALGRPIAD